MKDFLLTQFDISDEDIFYVLPCYDIDEYWNIEQQAIELQKNLQNE